eukprot:GAHX01001122.1.p1 GENE.GAHX01001122.1~~GAHX01001122.1.p1  ORF type:complete len:446 (+),score=90.45 GAHX01001122.1:193-1530(+)
MYVKLFEDSTQRHVLTTKDMIRAISNLKNRLDVKSRMYIDIAGNSIPAGPMKLLAQFLSTLNLVGLKMYDIMASLHHLEAYASLAVFTKYITKSKLDELEELDVSDNAFGEAGLRSLKDLLIKIIPNLKVLNLANIGFSKDACVFLKDTFLTCNEGNRSFPLETFICDNNYLSDQGCEDLVTILNNCPHLKNLQISASRISTEGLKYIIPTIRNCSKLEKLNLADTYFNDETFKELVDALNQHVTKLEELNLGMTSIELHQLELLFRLKLEKIKLFDISYNTMDWFEENNKICTTLIKFLDKYNTERLKLDGCSIETKHVVELIKGFNGASISMIECYSAEYKEEQIETLVDLLLEKKNSFEVCIDESQFCQIEDFEDYFKITKANKKVGKELMLEQLEDEKYRFVFRPELKEDETTPEENKVQDKPNSTKDSKEIENEISELKL